MGLFNWSSDSDSDRWWVAPSKDDDGNDKSAYLDAIDHDQGTGG